MSKIARRLTNMNEIELREHEYTIVKSAKDVVMTLGVYARQNVRFLSNLIIGNSDLDKKRNKMKLPLKRLLKK